MIGRLGYVLMLLFAINFLSIAGGVGYLAGTKKLDREKVMAIKEIIFPSTQPSAPATQPAETGDADDSAPSLKLEDLLVRQAGLSVAEQVESIQNTFDAKLAELDRRERELDDLQRQIAIAQQQLTRDRVVLSTDQTTLKQQQEAAEKLATNKGFQDSLNLYTTMPAKQAKQVFATLDDATVTLYLQSMQPRQAAKIVKEFKSPDEVKRIQNILEKMRQSEIAQTPKE